MPAITPPQSESGAKAGRRSPNWLWRMLLVVAVALAYGNSLQSPFLFDDLGAIQHNPTIRQWSTALQPPADGSTTTGRPLVNLSFALNHAVGGEQAWSYHALNLLIHAASTLLLFGLMRRTLTGPVLAGTFAAAAPLLAFFTALLWAVHPLQTESVTCIAQRTESLCGLFYLLTLYGLARGAGRPAAGRWFTLSGLACLAGMATKEVMVTAPLLVLLYDRTFVAGSFAAAWRSRRGYYVALAATWLLLAWLVLGRGGTRGVSAGFGLGISWWEYLLKQCEALVLYLKLSVWPHPLVLDYGTGVIRSLAEVWWQGPVVLALLMGTVWALLRRPVLGFVGAWFFIILAPSSSVVPLVTQTMAEHRMYLPLAGIMALLVLTLHRYYGARAGVGLGLLAVVFSGLTIARNHAYRSVLAIWTDTVAQCPESARAQVNLGVELLQLGQADEAAGHFAAAAKLQPGYVSAHYNWGAALLEQGRVPEAIMELETAVRLGPGHADARLAFGNALVQAQRAAEAVPQYEVALQLKPAADAHYNLGVALSELGRYEDAARHLQTALEMNSNLPDAHYQLGRVADHAGALPEAEKHYADALRLAPNHIAAHRRLGLLFARSERLAQAGEHFRAVLRLQPDDADAHANLGNVLLLQGQLRAAVAHYQEALRLRPDDSRTRENLQLARESLRP